MIVVVTSSLSLVVALSNQSHPCNYAMGTFVFHDEHNHLATGTCNFGMLNYYLGKRAADEGRDSRYPHIDFCQDPGAVCSRDDHPELKWIAGMFYWIRSLQTYNEGGWNYIEQLKGFVRGGMTDDAFIMAVSGIVNRGCHNPPCGSGSLDGGSERKDNFKKVMKILFEEDGSPRIHRPNEFPTYMPSLSPAKAPSSSPTKKSSLTAQPTATMDSQEEEDNTGSNFLCGRTQYDAIANCGRNGYDCADDGVCHNGLKCFMLADACDDTEEGEIATSKPTQMPTARPTPRPTPKPTTSPTSTPTAPLVSDKENIPSQPAGDTSSVTEFDVTETFFCGTNQIHASTFCHRRCRSGKRDECENGEACYGVPACAEEFESIKRQPPTTQPIFTPPPTPAPAKVSMNAPLPTYMPTWSTYKPTKSSLLEEEDASEPADDTSSVTVFDVTYTFFCGITRVHASASCHTRCRSGKPDECGEGETCFGYTDCEEEVESIKGQPPTKQPIFTPPPMPAPMKVSMNTPSSTYMPTWRRTSESTKSSSPEEESPSEPADATSSVTEFDVTDTYFCGTSRAHASAACHNRCRSGKPDECGEGETCFGYTDCEKELEATRIPLPTKQPIYTPPPSTRQPFFAPPMTTNTNDNQPNPPSGVALKSPPLPTAEPNEGSQQTPPLVQQQVPSLFCASAMSQLESSCELAESCAAGPCPKGQFCFPFTCTKIAEGREGELTLATTDDVDAGREVNQIPTDSQPSAPALADKQQTSSLCPQTNLVRWHVSADCKEYHKCNNGVPGVIRVCSQFLKFDKVRNECYSEELVNSFCYGPPLRELCKEGKTGWETMADCKEYYECNNGVSGVVRECSQSFKFDKVMNDCYPEELVNSFCYGPPLRTLCKEGKTGWETTADCREYYECDNGAPGIIRVCGQSLKFNQLRNECYPEELVDSFCYGPPLRELCKDGKTGWETMADCREYYKCNNGAPGIIRACGQYLKFDQVRNECYSEQSVNSLCRGPSLESVQGSRKDLCKESYTGWEVRLGCREYFWCDQGRVDVLYDCGEDLLFDRSLELCNFAHLVHCVDKGGPDTPKPRPTRRPVSLSLKTPGLPNSIGDNIGNNNGPEGEGVSGDHSSSNTVAPSPSKGQSDTPPWLMNTVVENNSAPVASSTFLFILICFAREVFLAFIDS